ncbi:tetratricopeptide repeat protein [Balneolaceae bacterium ANBcel3]|nr:tetratricopeptide repeat protein [Balneolaceae bacterium ANBcel3]
MKTNLFPKSILAIVLLFTVWACATDPNIESARVALLQADFDEVLEQALNAIESNPENADAYYYVGVAHVSFASAKPADERLDDYKKAKEAFDTAKRLYEEQDLSTNESENLPEVIIEVWGFEYNSALEPLTDQIVDSPTDSLTLAKHHLNNALTINPDSSHTYILLAEVYYGLGELEEAQRITETLIYEVGNKEIFSFYRLSLYLMESDRDEDAIRVLNEAREHHPDEIEVIQEIANAYLRLGETDKALETVQELIERDPENPQYRLVYGTQVYQMTQELDDMVRDTYRGIYDLMTEIRDKAREGKTDADLEDELNQLDEMHAEAEVMIQESFELSERAEQELLVALEGMPEEPMVHYTLGIVYQNRAAILQTQREFIDDLDEVEKLNERANEYLRQSLPFYEKATELDEDNQDYWLSLFRVYTHLGMMEEAEEAQRRAGL